MTTASMETSVATIGVFVAPADGVRVLRDVFRSLHGKFPGAIVIRLHAGTGRERGVADNLNVASNVMVLPAIDGVRLRDGHAYVMQAGSNLVLGVDGRFTPAYGDDAFQRGDGFLLSLAAHYGSGAIAVALAALDDLELAGFEAVRAGGGRTIALDEADRLWADSSGARIVPDVADEHLAAAAIGPRMLAMASSPTSSGEPMALLRKDGQERVTSE